MNFRHLESDINQWFVDNSEFGICIFESAEIKGDRLRVSFSEFENSNFLDLPLSYCNSNSEAFECFRDYYLNSHYALLQGGEF